MAKRWDGSLGLTQFCKCVMKTEHTQGDSDHTQRIFHEKIFSDTYTAMRLRILAVADLQLHTFQMHY